MSKKRGMNSATTNALPWVLHAIVQRRPTAHFRAGGDTAELSILPPPRSLRNRSLSSSMPVGIVRNQIGAAHKGLQAKRTHILRIWTSLIMPLRISHVHDP